MKDGEERQVRRTGFRRGRTGPAVAAVVALAAVAVVVEAGTGQAATPRAVLPVLETQVFPDSTGDVADDSAIWFDASNPSNSVVIADDKDVTGGLAVYDLGGRLLQYLPVGKIGNVDVRDGFVLGGRPVVLVGANNRTDDTIMFWSLDRVTRTLTPVSARAIRTLAPNYGFCFYRSAVSGRSYAFVTQKDGGRVEQYELTDSAGAVDAVPVRTLQLGSMAEGCVADDERGLLYVGEEDVALWRYGAEPDDVTPRVAVDQVGQGRLVADIEGLTITYGPNGSGNLLVSSQGDSTVAVYERGGGNAYVRSVSVQANGTVDAVTHTDGLDAFAGDFGGAFSGGLLVVHDDANSGAKTSNLKYVPLADVLAADAAPPPPAPGPAPGPATPVTTTLTAVADTYLSTTAHGGATSLKVSPSQYTALLRFDATKLPPTATVTSVVLQPYSPSAATCRYEVHAAGDTWTESAVKASTAPPVSAAVLGTSATLLSKQRMPVTLPTTAAPLGTRFTLAVKGASGCTLGYLASRETANGARLVVSYTTA